MIKTVYAIPRALIQTSKPTQKLISIQKQPSQTTCATECSHNLLRHLVTGGFNATNDLLNRIDPRVKDSEIWNALDARVGADGLRDKMDKMTKLDWWLDILRIRPFDNQEEALVKLLRENGIQARTVSSIQDLVNHLESGKPAYIGLKVEVENIHVPGRLDYGVNENGSPRETRPAVVFRPAYHRSLMSRLRGWASPSGYHAVLAITAFPVKNPLKPDAKVIVILDSGTGEIELWYDFELMETSFSSVLVDPP